MHDFCTMAAGGVRHVNMWRFSVRCRVAQIYHWGSLIAAFITFTITALFSRLHLLAHRISFFFFVPIFKVQVISIRDLHEGGRRQTVREIRAERKLSLYPSSLPPTHPFYPPATSSEQPPPPCLRFFFKLLSAFAKTVKYRGDSGSILPQPSSSPTRLSESSNIWTRTRTSTHRRTCRSSSQRCTMMSQARSQTVIKGFAVIWDQFVDVRRLCGWGHKEPSCYPLSSSAWFTN